MTTNADHLCPITGEVMKDPVLAADGHTYERAAITAWMERTPTSPLTGLIMSNRTLLPNVALRSAIAEASRAAGAPSTPPVLAPAPTPSSAAPAPPPLTLELFHHAAPHSLVHARVTAPPNAAVLPVALVAVLDVSGSMNNPATEGNGKPVEGGQFSRLDLVKHSVLTAANMLTDRDVLSLVTFSDRASRVLHNVRMDEAGKKYVAERLDVLEPMGGTNLFQGVSAGLDAAADLAASSPSSTFAHLNVIVLTDGEPTRDYDPPRGILPSVAHKLSQGPVLTLSTIAYGYGDGLDSPLMREMAKLGRGTFAYVPDGSMVGTVFIHLIANMTLAARRDVALEVGARTEYVGAVQPGQSRDVWLPFSAFSGAAGAATPIRLGGELRAVTIEPAAADAQGPYESLRREFTAAISSAIAFMEGSQDEKAALALLDKLSERLKAGAAADPRVANMLSDVKHEDPNKGQISLAIRNWKRWGKHYLPSVEFAHLRQERVNFKDLAMYAYGGPRLSAAVDRGDEIFASIPAPMPSIDPLVSQLQGLGASALGGRGGAGGAGVPLAQVATFNMANLNNRWGGCFSPDTVVVMADGSCKPVKDVRKGDAVAATVAGPAGGAEAGSREPPTVVCVVRYLKRGADGCALSRLGEDVALTPYHPVRTPEATRNGRKRGGADAGAKSKQGERGKWAKWAFPETMQPAKVESGVRCVYNLVLSTQHEVLLGKERAVAACTLGHGFQEDVVKHPYFGSDAVLEDLRGMQGWAEGLVEIDEAKGHGFVRDPESGDVVGMRV